MRPSSSRSTCCGTRCISIQSFERESSQYIHQIRVRALEGMALGTAGFLRSMIELEAGGALDVVIPAVSQRVVRADDHRLATSRKLGCGELLLVVFLEGRSELLHEAGFGDGQGLDVCIGILVSGFLAGRTRSLQLAGYDI